MGHCWYFQVAPLSDLCLKLITTGRSTDFTEAKIQRLQEKIALLKQQMAKLDTFETALQKTPDKQISLTDPDARSMDTSGRGRGGVGYNVQTAVDTKNHLIVAHEVTHVGHDRNQLANMAEQAKAAMGVSDLNVVLTEVISAEKKFANAMKPVLPHSYPSA